MIVKVESATGDMVGTTRDTVGTDCLCFYLMSVAFSMIYVSCSCNEHGCPAFVENLAIIYLFPCI